MPGGNPILPRVLKEKLESIAVGKDIWNTLLNVLPQGPIPRCIEDNRWVAGPLHGWNGMECLTHF